MSKSSAFVRWWLLAAVLFVMAAGGVRAAEIIPAEPTRYFNDYALTVRPATADKLNAELADLEKQSSNQILVAIFPKMQTDSAVDHYCLRIFRAWKVGQKDKNNGAVLFVFVQDHKLWIQTGRGIEGALPDATCKDIIADRITPLFKNGDYDGGLTAGVEAMIAATKGEYKGDGQTDYQKQHPATDDASNGNGGGIGIGTIFFLIILFFIVSRFFRRAGGTTFTGAGPIIWGSMLGGLGGGGGVGGGVGATAAGFPPAAATRAAAARAAVGKRRSFPP